MNIESITNLVIYTAFGAMMGWYFWIIGYSIYCLVKWIRRKSRERKEKKAE